ncbi:MAG: AAA family ATPase, partial [Muribaculaceae bacterium]|nr:AAA family ATPase [Muribaculaceae bacterium]
FIKALTFLFYNISNPKSNREIHPSFIDEVSFYHSSVANFDWGDFATTLHRGGEDNNISFKWETRGVEFQLSFGASIDEIRMNPSLLATLPIKNLYVAYYNRGVVFENRYSDNGWTMVAHVEIELLKSWLDETCSWLNARIDKVNDRTKIIDDQSLEWKYLDSWDRTRNRRFNERITTQLSDYNEALTALESSSDEVIEFAYTTDVSQPLQIALRDYCDFCCKIITEDVTRTFSESTNFAYIEAHNAPHTHAIPANDKNSFLARTVNEFYSQVPYVPENYDLYAWVNNWMIKFNIGDFFEINTHFGGEILTVGIGKNPELAEHIHGSMPMMPLASLGTGSIQLFVLLLKIATIIKRIGKDGFVTIIIEEPEQNLHPKLQSILAELFLDVHQKAARRVRFIVETHSEYIIRQTQVIVSGLKLSQDKLEKGNPFKVYYFPEKGLPYDMGYKSNGYFEEAFGEGFFDEAGNKYIELSCNNRR